MVARDAPSSAHASFGTKTALEITGKVHALLEQLSESAAPETKSKP